MLEKIGYAITVEIDLQTGQVRIGTFGRIEIGLHPIAVKPNVIEGNGHGWAERKAKDPSTRGAGSHQGF